MCLSGFVIHFSYQLLSFDCGKYGETRKAELIRENGLILNLKAVLDFLLVLTSRSLKIETEMFNNPSFRDG